MSPWYRYKCSFGVKSVFHLCLNHQRLWHIKLVDLHHFEQSCICVLWYKFCLFPLCHCQRLSWIIIGDSLKWVEKCRHTRQHYHGSWTSSLWPFSWILYAWRRKNKFYVYIYIVFGVTWLNRQYIAFEVNTLFLKQKICIKYVAINTYFCTYEYECLNMTEFRTVRNLLDQTITRLEKKKQDEREGIL